MLALLLLLQCLLPCLPEPVLGAAATPGVYALSSPNITHGSLEWPLTSTGVRIAPALFTVYPALLTPAEVASLLALVSPLPLDEDADTVDSLATHELYLERSGTLTGIQGIAGKPDSLPAVFERRLPARMSLAELTAPIVSQRILPLVNAQLPVACRPSCRVCHSLVRRYTEGQRLVHPTHFDVQALATVVIPLSTFGADFEGGLYVSTGAGYAGTESFLPLAAGDAVLHQSTLLHGVRVTSGQRWSWVLWLKNAASGEACEGVDAAEWTRGAAEAGDPLAMFLLARRLPEGQGLPWLQRAAQAGFPRAASEYGQALVEGRGGAWGRAAEAQGRPWLEAAAAAGEPEGLYNLGLLEVRPGGNTTRAVGLFQQAAGRGLAAAAANVGVALYNGAGVAKDVGAALHWFEQAGDERSLLLAARIAEAGQPPGLLPDAAAAVRLLQRAAAGGSKEAAGLLAARGQGRAAAVGQEL